MDQMGGISQETAWSVGDVGHEKAWYSIPVFQLSLRVVASQLIERRCLYNCGRGSGLWRIHG